MKIQLTRQAFTAEHRRLNRARRLYVWLARHEIQDWPSLEMVAEAMISTGLYWPGQSVHGAAYSIIKALYGCYFEHGESLQHWWAWMERFQWCGKPGRHTDPRLKEAARHFPFEKLPWQR